MAKIVDDIFYDTINEQGLCKWCKTSSGEDRFYHLYDRLYSTNLMIAHNYLNYLSPSTGQDSLKRNFVIRKGRFKLCDRSLRWSGNGDISFQFGGYATTGFMACEGINIEV